MIEFQSVFKKLLVCHPLLTSVDHNVISNATGILTVSSRSKSKRTSVTAQPESMLMPEIYSYEYEMLEEIENMEPYEQHICAYLALCIEAKVLQDLATPKKCKICAEVLYSPSEKINDEFLALKGDDSKQPSESTIKIVIFANAIMKKISAEHRQGNSFNAVSKAICEYLDIDDVYAEFHTAHHDEDGLSTREHKKLFIAQIINTYMTMKSKNIGKKITEEERGDLIRQRNKRNVIVAGQ